jgi:pimeloyl-ACP methyl ester carboxylesterase
LEGCKTLAFIDIRGVNIYYEIHGEGEYLVLLHHGIGSSVMWKPFLPKLVTKYRVLFYDRRGFGQSEPGEDFSYYYHNDDHREACVKELTDILSSLNITSKINIIGQCEGGAIALNFAAHYPQQVKCVVTSSTQCYSTVSMTEFMKNNFPPFEELPDSFKKHLVKLHGETRAIELYLHFRQGGGAYGMSMYDIRSILAKTQCPALIIYGDRGHLFSVEQAVSMYRSLPRGELAVLPNCGHNTYYDQPSEYFMQIKKFLARHNN